MSIAIRRRRFVRMSGLLPTSLVIRAAYPQPRYSARTVRIIAPVAPWGGVDRVARTVAERLATSMNGSFVVENIAGGGGGIASQTVARAASDGDTRMVGYVGTHGTAPALRKLPYDAVRDFSPVAMVGGTANVLVVSPTLRAGIRSCLRCLRSRSAASGVSTVSSGMALSARPRCPRRSFSA